jgi:pimeloyl-ACP methyl ester carboxylesterase
MASLAVPDSIVRVSLREGGPSAPLVFIHGFLGGPRSFDALARASAHRGEVVGLRLPGHGLEPWGVGRRARDALNELRPRSRRKGPTWSATPWGRVALLAASSPSACGRSPVVGAHAGSPATERAPARRPTPSVRRGCARTVARS